MANGKIKTRVVGAESGRKLLNVLLLFTPKRPVWTVGEIGQTLELPQSMVYRYVGLLREVGLLDTAGGKNYRVTELVRTLTDAAVAARAPLSTVSLPVLTELRDASGETAYVMRRSGWFAYVVERVETSYPIRLLFERGQALVLYQGAGSRLLLAELAHAERAVYFELFGVDRRKYHAELLADSALDAVLKEGVAESHEEVGQGIWSVAAIVRDDIETVGVVGVAAPLYRVNVAQRKEIRHLVNEAAHTISKSFQPPMAKNEAPK